MLNTKIMTLSSKFFICMFLYPLLSLNCLATVYKISSSAILEYIEVSKTIESNAPEVIVKYDSSSLEIKTHWEIVENGNVILFYDIKSLNWRKISELSFENDFENKFEILLEKSYWIPFGSENKEYFEENGTLTDTQVNISLIGTKLDFKTKKEIPLTGNGILAIYLKPNYSLFAGEVYKSQTEYSYKNDRNKVVTKINYAPNFYFLDNQKSEITILRYQTIDVNKDNKIDFPYQLEEFTANVGDTVYYKVEITNNMEETIYNLNITNPIGEYSKLSLGDKLLTGTGYPIIELPNGEIVEITTYPRDERGGKIEFFLMELKSKETINIYYCVEIIR